MKRFLVVLLIIAAMAGAAYASAATLGVEGGTVQAGADYTVSCQANPVHVTAWAVNSIVGPYEGLDWVVVSGVEESCVGDDIVIRVDTTAGPAYGAAYPGDPSAAGPDLPWAPQITSGKSDYKFALYHAQSPDVAPYGPNRFWVPAENITGIKVWIGGPTGGTF